ncbi:hypothetical protein J7643_19150 [bacterium]|nr:hypothetical protein [bacterium]
MPLNKTALNNAIRTLLNKTDPEAMTPEAAAEALANAIEAFVKSGTVSGSVTVPGSGLLSPQGPVTGSASGSMSSGSIA